MPFFLIEARYENEQGATELIVRSQAFQALLSGASGHVMGIWPMWAFASGWQTALNSRGSVTLPHMRALFEARSWWTLQPDTSGQFMTGGAESGVNRAVAATAADRSFAVSYMPTIRTLTLNLGAAGRSQGQCALVRSRQRSLHTRHRFTIQRDRLADVPSGRQQQQQLRRLDAGARVDAMTPA